MAFPEKPLPTTFLEGNLSIGKLDDSGISPDEIEQAIVDKVEAAVAAGFSINYQATVLAEGWVCQRNSS